MCTPNDLCLGISAHQDEAYAPPRPQSLGLPGSILLGPIQATFVYLLTTPRSRVGYYGRLSTPSPILPPDSSVLEPLEFMPESPSAPPKSYALKNLPSLEPERSQQQRAKQV